MGEDIPEGAFEGVDVPDPGCPGHEVLPELLIRAFLNEYRQDVPDIDARVDPQRKIPGSARRQYFFCDNVPRMCHEDVNRERSSGVNDRSMPWSAVTERILVEIVGRRFENIVHIDPFCTERPGGMKTCYMGTDHELVVVFHDAEIVGLFHTFEFHERSFARKEKIEIPEHGIFQIPGKK